MDPIKYARDYSYIANLLNQIINSTNLSYLMANYQLKLAERWDNMAQTTTDWSDFNMQQYLELQEKVYSFTTAIMLASSSRRNCLSCCLNAIKYHPVTTISKHYDRLNALFQVISADALGRMPEGNFQQYIVYPLVNFYNETQSSYSQLQSTLLSVMIHFDPHNRQLIAISNGSDPVAIKDDVSDGELLTDIISRIY